MHFGVLGRTAPGPGSSRRRVPAARGRNRVTTGRCRAGAGAQHGNALTNQPTCTSLISISYSVLAHAVCEPTQSGNAEWNVRTWYLQSHSAL